MIEILTSGPPNVVQDQGRPQHLSLGVSRSGALDPFALACANIAVGNGEAAAGIEISYFPFRLRFHRVTTVSCTGASCPVRLDGTELPPWWTLTVQAGQELRLDLPRRGARAYLAFDGGVDVPEVLGSRATDLKSGYGGVEGRGLKRGDQLGLGRPIDAKPVDFGFLPGLLATYLEELRSGTVQVNAIPAAEYDAFTLQSLEVFTSTSFRITPDANRMGYRLQGERLDRTEAVELLSHGIVPGTVQVPPAGQPIIQMAEANTCGGYPKIATVIPSDLWKLGQAPVGTDIRFRLVDHTAAVRELQVFQAAMDRIRNLRHAADSL